MVLSLLQTVIGSLWKDAQPEFQKEVYRFFELFLK